MNAFKFVAEIEMGNGAFIRATIEGGADIGVETYGNGFYEGSSHCIDQLSITDIIGEVYDSEGNHEEFSTDGRGFERRFGKQAMREVYNCIDESLGV